MKKLFFLLSVAITLHTNAQVLRTRTLKLMGSRFDISIVADDSATAEHNIDTAIAEITRIEYLISDWIPTTQVSQVNQFAGIKPVRVDHELIELTQRALELSRITNGAFDISFAAMEKIWRFDGSMTELPSPEAVNKARARVGYRNIIVDSLNSTIFMKLRGMKIGFGALGEGYAADRCKAIMISKGIKAGIVNGSGDMNTWGQQPDGSAWNIGINNPFNSGALYAIVPLKHGAVVTSGSYEKYVELDGKRYAHIINPATGYPATGLTSVTIFGPGAELANGLSTSIMVLGKKKGLRLLKQYPDYTAIIISDNGKFVASRGVKLRKFRKAARRAQD